MSNKAASPGGRSAFLVVVELFIELVWCMSCISAGSSRFSYTCRLLRLMRCFCSASLGLSPCGTCLYFTLASRCGSVWRGHHCMCPSLYAGMGPVLWSSLGTSSWLLLPGGLHCLGSMGRLYSADRWRCPYTSWYQCWISGLACSNLLWGLALFAACFFPLNALLVKVLRAVFPVRAWTLFWWWSMVVLLLYLFGAVVEFLLVLLSLQNDESLAWRFVVACAVWCPGPGHLAWHRAEWVGLLCLGCHLVRHPVSQHSAAHFAMCGVWHCPLHIGFAGH